MAQPPGRERNKKESLDNPFVQLHSVGCKKNKMGGNPATQKKIFKEYLQLSLFPDIVPHYKTTNITNNGNNKQTSITKDG